MSRPVMAGPLDRVMVTQILAGFSVRVNTTEPRPAGLQLF